MTDRYQQGLQRLSEVDGQAGERAVAEMAARRPELSRYIVEFAFGDVYSRPGLDLRSREIATIARKVARKIAENKKAPSRITANMVPDYLGIPKLRDLEA